MVSAGAHGRQTGQTDGQYQQPGPQYCGRKNSIKKTQLRLRLFILYHCLPSVDTAPVSQRIGSVAVRTDRAAKEHQVDSKEKADQRNEGQQYHERAVVKVMQTSDVKRQAAERGDKCQSKGQYLEHRSVWRKQTADQIAQTPDDGITQ